MSFPYWHSGVVVAMSWPWASSQASRPVEDLDGAEASGRLVLSAGPSEASGEFLDDYRRSHPGVGPAHQAGPAGLLFDGYRRLDEVGEAPDGVREVVGPAPGLHAAVPVDQRYCRVSAEDGVVGTQVTVADHLLIVAQVGGGGGVVVCADEGGGAEQLGVGEPERWSVRHQALDVGQDLPALLVIPQGQGGAGEADRFQVPEQRVYEI